jgi:hypothetical protein
MSLRTLVSGSQRRMLLAGGIVFASVQGLASCATDGTSAERTPFREESTPHTAGDGSTPSAQDAGEMRPPRDASVPDLEVDAAPQRDAANPMPTECPRDAGPVQLEGLPPFLFMPFLVDSECDPVNGRYLLKNVGTYLLGRRRLGSSFGS